MTVQEKKLDIIKTILNVKDAAVLMRVENALSDEEVAVSDEVLKSINKGLKELQQGKKTPHNQVRKIYEKWL